jgi:hypothetical protein
MHRKLFALTLSNPCAYPEMRADVARSAEIERFVDAAASAAAANY